MFTITILNITLLQIDHNMSEIHITLLQIPLSLKLSRDKGWWGWGDGAPFHCFTCSALEISSPTLLLSRNNGGLKSPLIKNITDRSQI